MRIVARMKLPARLAHCRRVLRTASAMRDGRGVKDTCPRIVPISRLATRYRLHPGYKFGTSFLTVSIRSGGVR